MSDYTLEQAKIDIARLQNQMNQRDRIAKAFPNLFDIRGNLKLANAPTIDLHAATKKYVDDSVGGAIGDWIPYTPSWTATTTNPSIGNGTLSGEYLQIGNIVHVALTMRAGSTTTFGAGEWRFNYPVAPNTDWTNIYQVGSAYLFDYGSVRYLGYTQYAGSSLFSLLASNPVSATYPFTWNAANGDYLEVNFWYKAA